MPMNPISKDQALAFLRSHDLPRVTQTKHDITAWASCVNMNEPGGEFVERMDFRPDIYGLYELGEIRNWLGY